MERNNRGLVVVLGVLILAVLIGPLLMGGMMGSGGVGPGMALGGLLMWAFWGALVVGVVLLVRWTTGHRTASKNGSDEWKS